MERKRYRRLVNRSVCVVRGLLRVHVIIHNMDNIIYIYIMGYYCIIVVDREIIMVRDTNNSRVGPT